MADVVEPVWQDNYADLGDDATIRFGGECAICQARFATVAIPVAYLPAGDVGLASSSLEDQKFAAFSAFDAAFRSILIPCYRCGNLACPECWDVDKQMCGACVAERGLIRSPHRGGPVEGPLADGSLRRIEPGRYSEAGRPAWLKQLLRAQADPPAARSMSSPSLSIAGLANQAAAAHAGTTLDAGDSLHLVAPALPFNPQQFDTPTYKLPASPATAMPQPTFQDTLNGNEGEATASLIACPQCGARNYDFVTQCVECGLQLIQVCPRCEQINGGHATRCDACGAPLERPSGWTAVRSPVLQLQRGETQLAGADQPARPVSLKEQPNKRPVNNSGAATLKPAPQRANYATPALGDQPAVAFATPGLAASVAVSGHPYELAGAGSRPTRAAARKAKRATQAPKPAARVNAYRPSVLGGIGLALERLLVLVLVLALLAVIVAAVAAEQSPAANHWLSLMVHFDVKSHLDKMLYWLKNELRVQPQS